MDNMEEDWEVPEENGNKMDKKKLMALIIILLVLTIAIPLSFLSLFLREEGESTYYLTFKEFYDKYHSQDLIDGDVIYVKDVFSGIWYDEEAQYTYITFKSMDAERTVSWGYDIGYQENITDEYQEGDEVIIKIEMSQQIIDGTPRLVAKLDSIEHA
jgi:cytochrome c-type biogenesis protein CcmE